MSSDVNVRLVQAGDGPDARAVAELLIHSHEEIGVAPVDPGMAYAVVLEKIANEAVYLAEQDGKAVGTLCLELAPLWFNPAQQHLWNLWLYVRGEKRHGPATRALTDEARALARDTNLPLMLMRPTILETVN